MKAKDYAKIMSLPPEERLDLIEEEKKRMFAEGTLAASVFAYLESYFEEEHKNYFKAFEELPPDAELKHYQTVKFGLIALRNLEANIKNKIRDANQIIEHGTRSENKNLNA